MPTPAKALYAWHRAALAGDTPPVHDGLPECGWFKTRMVKGGPWVAVEIRVEREIDISTGELVEPEKVVAVANGNHIDTADLTGLWIMLRPISRDEHIKLVAMIAANPAMHDPYRKIDLLQHGAAR